jgi:hypothetical protein
MVLSCFVVCLAGPVCDFRLQNLFEIVSETTLAYIRRRSWEIPMDAPASQLSDVIPRSLGDDSSQTLTTSHAVGALPWPEGAYTSPLHDVTFRVSGTVTGHLVSGVLGFTDNLWDSATAAWLSQRDVREATFRLPAAHASEVVQLYHDALRLCDPAALSLPLMDVMGDTNDVQAAFRLNKPDHITQLIYCAEGYESAGASTVPFPRDASVVVRVDDVKFALGDVETVRPGFARVRIQPSDTDVDSDSDGIVVWKAWRDLFENESATIGNIVDSSVASSDQSWFRSVAGIGSRVFVGVIPTGTFQMGAILRVWLCP